MEFWDAIRADLRLANGVSLSGAVADPTVVLPVGKLAQLGAMTNRQIASELANIETNDIDVNYSWGNTGFGFQLPVYFQPYQLSAESPADGAIGVQSRFLGRTRSKDLLVMDVNAGINFIEPSRTRLSFGASADFTRLGEISIQIDIADPDSLAKVDGVLLSLNIIDTPLLQPTLQDFMDSVDVVNRFAGRGLDKGIEEGLELLLRESATAIASITPNKQDPFVTVSNGLATIQNTPAQVLSLATDGIRQPLDALDAQLRLQINGRLDDLLQEIIVLEQMPTGSPAAEQAIDDQVDRIIAIIDSVNGLVSQLDSDIGSIVVAVDSALARGDSLIQDARGRVSEVVAALQTVQQITQTAIREAQSACDSRTDFTPESAGYLKTAFRRIGSSRELLANLGDSGELFTVLALLIEDAEEKRLLDQSQRRINIIVNEIGRYLEDAETAVKGAVCDQQKIDDVVIALDSFINPMLQEVEDAGDLLDKVGEDIGDLKNISVELVRLKQRVNSLAAGLDALPQKLQVAVAAQKSVVLQTSLGEIFCALSELPSSCASNGVVSLKIWVNEQFDTAKSAAVAQFVDTTSQVSGQLTNVMTGVYMTPEQLRQLLVREIMKTGPVKAVRVTMNQHFSEINKRLNDVILQYVAKLNSAVQTAMNDVTGEINEALAEATAEIRDMPVQAGQIDGFATIAGGELERLYLGAEWTMPGAGKDKPTRFKGDLNVLRLSVRNEPETGEPETSLCQTSSAESLLDVRIGAYDVPLTVAASKISITELGLGFTLDTVNAVPLPVGINGDIMTLGVIKFGDSSIIDPGLVAGVGLLQSYVGATASGNFSDVNVEKLAFLVGKVCPGNKAALSSLDDRLEEFIPGTTQRGFSGAYARGGATFPIIPGGCFLNVSLSADFGAWLLLNQPVTFGGMVGGGASGEAACVAALKGKGLVSGSLNTDGDLYLLGEAWGVAGAGFDCDPETWTSVARSRDDSWCGTADVQMELTFDNGDWVFDPPSPDWLF